MLRPRLEGRVLVTQERLSFGIGSPQYEFQDTHGNITFRSMLMPGRNEIRHDALVAVSSLPDTREIYGAIKPVSELAQVAQGSGLQWVNSDAAKIAVVQAAIAAEPKLIHMPRERAPVVVSQEGPLVLVETKRDLRETKLPFEQQIGASPSQ